MWSMREQATLATTADPALVSNASGPTSVLNDVSSALQDVPNPRATTHATSATPGYGRGGRFTAAAATSRMILSAMQTSHSNAIQHHATQGGPPPAPILSAAMSSPAVGNVFVSVMVMYFNGAKVKTFSPYSGTFPGSDVFDSLLSAVRVHVDAQCSRPVIFKPPKRIYSNESVELRFLSSKLPCTSPTLDGTIWEVYTTHKGNGHYIPPKKGRDNGASMEFSVHVAYTEPEEQMIRSGVKRKASQKEFKSRVRTRVHGSSHSISDDATKLSLFRTCLRITDVKSTEDGGENEAEIDMEEHTSQNPIDCKIYFDKEIGRGESKKVFKLQLLNADGTSGAQYAAKVFISGPNGEAITPEVNASLCHEEMRRTMHARQVADKFSELCREKNISIHDIEFLAPTLLHEHAEKEDIGRMWICDKFVLGKVEKFSGTDEAGKHDESNFAGLTCDALAHFSLASSDNEKLLVDLQGIIRRKAGIPPKLKLFDVQLHSSAQDAGLGDNGLDGIEEFREQHHCNRICHALSLPSLE
ncbi:hypothetical protein FRB91_006306 [Serendipita sp. 411]|nr:hypothetical protein FRC19_008558 [Serendipita sp. 401]KAG8852632.1 hypothetical protein FRB91_006306 [Serendipita sp. 411]KAG9048524.1 hypothetical protein FS842_000384 [Serendipita sp. 407]